MHTTSYTKPLIVLDVKLSVKVEIYKNIFTGLNHKGLNSLRFLDPVAQQQRINLREKVKYLVGGVKTSIK